eukprot:2105642-Rhodomonas_salina.1
MPVLVLLHRRQRALCPSLPVARTPPETRAPPEHAARRTRAGPDAGPEVEHEGGADNGRCGQVRRTPATLRRRAIPTDFKAGILFIVSAGMGILGGVRWQAPSSAVPSPVRVCLQLRSAVPSRIEVVVLRVARVQFGLVARRVGEEEVQGPGVSARAQRERQHQARAQAREHPWR